MMKKTIIISLVKSTGLKWVKNGEKWVNCLVKSGEYWVKKGKSVFTQYSPEFTLILPLNLPFFTQNLPGKNKTVFTHYLPNIHCFLLW